MNERGRMKSAAPLVVCRFPLKATCKQGKTEKSMERCMEKE